MKVLLTGSTEHMSVQRVSEVLDKIHSKRRITELVVPGSRGIAEAGILWGLRNNVKRANFYLDDCMAQSAAIVLRIGAMLKTDPDLVVGFPGAGETSALLVRAQDAGVRILLIPEEEEVA